MTKEELLKEIMKLPKVETNNPISTMTSINVDDLMSAVDRLNKVPDYNDLLKENQELKKQLENANEKIILLQASEPMLNYKKALEETRQKEFIEWLENGIEKVKNTEFLDERIQRAGLIAYNRVLSKYKEIIGDDK